MAVRIALFLLLMASLPGGRSPTATGSATVARQAFQEAATDRSAELKKLFDSALQTVDASSTYSFTQWVADLPLPDHANWLQRNLKTTSQSVDQYESIRERLLLATGALRQQLLHCREQGINRVSVRRIVRSDDTNAWRQQTILLQARKTDFPIYSVWLSNFDNSRHAHIYSFVFVAGKFRYLGPLTDVFSQR